MNKLYIIYIFLFPEKEASPLSPLTVDTKLSLLDLPKPALNGSFSNPNQKLIINKNSCVKCGATFVSKPQLDKHLLLHSPTSQVHITFHN